MSGARASGVRCCCCHAAPACLVRLLLPPPLQLCASCEQHRPGEQTAPGVRTPGCPLCWCHSTLHPPCALPCLQEILLTEFRQIIEKEVGVLKPMYGALPQ